MFKKFNSKKTTAILIALVLVTSLFIGGSIARYVTSTSSEDEARVAKWGFSETAEPITMDLFKNEYKLEDNTVVARSDNGDNIIAPGLNGVSKFKFITSSVSPEVMYEVKISLDDSEVADEIKNHPGIQWKVDNGNWVTWDEMVSSLVSLSGDPSGIKVYAPGELHDNFKSNVEHTIAWQWIMDSGYDVEDTTIGNLSAKGTPITAKIVVEVTAKQINKSEKDTENTNIIHNGIIPKGGTYYVNATVDRVSVIGDYNNAVALTEGEPFPETVNPGDVYVYGDYEYRNRYFYSMDINYDGTNFVEPYDAWNYVDNYDCWYPRVIDDSKTNYGEIISEINGVRTGSLDYTFKKCASLVEAPTIPTTVSTMQGTFSGCTSLKKAPSIPEGVVVLNYTFSDCTLLTEVPNIPQDLFIFDGAFSGCTNITEAPPIPSTVISMRSTFDGCSKLSGSIEINSNTDSFYRLLSGTNITEITGSTPYKTEILATKTQM